MAQSKAVTVDDYLAELPADRRDALQRLREMIRAAAPAAAEHMAHGMASYTLGGSILFALAAQKNYLALYVVETDVVAAHKEALGKLDCGKSCIRFRKLDQLPTDVVAAILRDATAKRT